MTFEKDIEPIIVKAFNDTSYMYYAMLNDILNVVNKYYVSIEKIDEKIEKIPITSQDVITTSFYGGYKTALKELEQEISK